MHNDKKPTEQTNKAEVKQQNQDFQNIPAASENQNPPDISKNDIKKTSKLNETGKMDNTEKNS